MHRRSAPAGDNAWRGRPAHVFRTKELRGRGALATDFFQMSWGQSEEFRADFESTFRAFAAGDDAQAGGEAEAIGGDDDPVEIVFPHAFGCGEADAVKREVGDQDFLLRRGGASAGGVAEPRGHASCFAFAATAIDGVGNDRPGFFEGFVGHLDRIGWTGCRLRLRNIKELTPVIKNV